MILDIYFFIDKELQKQHLQTVMKKLCKVHETWENMIIVWKQWCFVEKKFFFLLPMGP